MTRRQAKHWACAYTAATMASDMDNAESLTDETDPDLTLKRSAMLELIRELQRRAKGE